MTSIKDTHSAVIAAALLCSSALGAGDLVHIQHLFRFLNESSEFQRMLRSVGGPTLDWSPYGLTAPRRFVCVCVGVCVLSIDHVQ
jgi:hypothetical protein